MQLGTTVGIADRAAVHGNPRIVGEAGSESPHVLGMSLKRVHRAGTSLQQPFYDGSLLGPHVDHRGPLKLRQQRGEQ